MSSVVVSYYAPFDNERRARVGERIVEHLRDAAGGNGGQGLELRQSGESAIALRRRLLGCRSRLVVLTHRVRLVIDGCANPDNQR